MAHFAKLNDDNEVIDVIVISNDTSSELDGITACTELTGYDKWVQTSFNNTIRRKFAAIGDTYYPDLDAFVSPAPYPSWVLDEAGVWQPPTPKPGVDDDTTYHQWDEETRSWVIVLLKSQ